MFRRMNQNSSETKENIDAVEEEREKRQINLNLYTFSTDSTGTLRKKKLNIVAELNNVKDIVIFSRRIEYHFYTAQIIRLNSVLDSLSLMLKNKQLNFQEDLSIYSKRKIVEEMKNVYITMIPLLESIEEKTCAVEDKYAQLWAYAAGAPIKIVLDGIKPFMEQMKLLMKDGCDSDDIKKQSMVCKELKECISGLLALNFMTRKNNVYYNSRIHFSMGDVGYFLCVCEQIYKYEKEKDILKSVQSDDIVITKLIITKAARKIQMKTKAEWKWADMDF